MRKVMFLTSDRKPAQACLKIFVEAEQRGLLDLGSVVADGSFLEKAKKVLKKETVFFENNKRNEEEICQTIKNLKINLIISVQHKWIISQKIIDAVDGLAFNIHFGRLPDYRGHHTHVHPILNGEQDVSIALHWMVPKVDMGDIVFEEISQIEDKDTSWSVMQKATKDSAKLLEKFLGHLSDNKEIPRISIQGKGCFYGIDSIFPLKEVKSLEDYDEVDRKSRAFYYPPHEPAYFLLNGKRFYIIPETIYEKDKNAVYEYNPGIKL